MRVFTSIATGVIVAIIMGVTVPVHAQENEEKQEKVEVEVEKGDTLSAIAHDHDTTYINLFNANKAIEHPDLIYPGDVVYIPEEDEEFEAREIPQSYTHQQVESAQERAETTQAYTQEVQAAEQTSAQPAPDPTPEPVATNVDGGVWDRLAECESSGNWSINTGNGYYGGLQFSLSSWQAVGGSGYPHQASKAEQINRAEKLKAIQGWGAWPACTEKLGLR